MPWLPYATARNFSCFPVFAQFGLTVQRLKFEGDVPCIGSPEHQHLEVECVLVSEAEVEFTVDSKRYGVQGGALLVFWGLSPHRMVSFNRTPKSRDPVFNCLRIPLDAYMRWRIPEEFRGFILGRNTWFYQLRDREEAELLQCWFRQWERDAVNCPEAAQLMEFEAELFLRRLAMIWKQDGAVAGGKSMTSVQGLSIFAEAIRFLVENVGEPQVVEKVSKVLGISRQYVHRLFRRHLGITVIEFLSRFRISQAQLLLTHTDDKIIDVALAAGFGTVSQFNRVFKTLLGSSPVQFRRDSQGATTLM